MPDAHAFRVVAIGSEGRGARRADPLAAALVTAFLFFQTFFQRLHQFVETTEGFDEFFLFVGEDFFRELAQPFLGKFFAEKIVKFFHAFEILGEGAIEAIEVGFIFDQADARQMIEVIDIAIDDVLVEAVEQVQKLADRARHAAFF